MLLSEATARCRAEIDLDALKHNYFEAQGLLSPGARLMCVLKANAYGLGAKTVSEFLFGLGARHFAVACASEAEEIKRNLPEANVLILGLVSKEECERAIELGISLTCYSSESAEQIASCALNASKPARVHIKADTGLHRLGFDINDTKGLERFLNAKNVKIEGLYTHLALRDAENDARQFELLDRFDLLLKQNGVSDYAVHACDSIGMVRYPEKHLDFVRAGAWLYGVCPYRYEQPERDLLTVRFVTRISNIHSVPKGECIGYDEEHPVLRDSRVATLSAGYVDGFPRLNNKGEVVIRGKRAKVLGLVCMDQMMVDVTDIPEASTGDEATLLGDGIGLDEYARVASLNRNEALSRLGRRVPRVYMQDGKVTKILLEM